MRKGKNPNNNTSKTYVGFIHQVVIPVYIPDEIGYFKDGLKVLKASLQSLLKTSHEKTFITIVNNGSFYKVTDYLNILFLEGLVHEIIHTSNIGKVNAVMKSVKGHYFKVITIADADTFFLSNWQNEVVNVFNTFPKAGVVGMVPQFKLYDYLCTNVLFDYALSKKMRFTEVVNPEAMKHFYKSIGWDDNYNQDFLKVNLTLQSKQGLRAIVGSGHFVATYRSETFMNSPSYEIKELLGSKSDRDFLDYPILKKGGYRLTTEDNYAYHMGNVYEGWMEEVLIKLSKPKEILEVDLKPVSSSKSSYFIKNHLFRKLTENKNFINAFIKFKGLPQDMTKTPWHDW